MPNHDHQLCIEKAILDATEICQKRNIRFTQIRRQVLELVWTSHRAIKAYEILAMLSKDGKIPQPPTVYRALDFLLEQGFIHRVESQNAFIGCINPEHQHNCHLLICDKCGVIEELCSEEVNKQLLEATKKLNFQIRNITLEIRGICKNCR